MAAERASHVLESSGRARARTSQGASLSVLEQTPRAPRRPIMQEPARRARPVLAEKISLAAMKRVGSALVSLDIGDDVLDGANLLSVFVGDFDIEFFLERHHQLDNIQRVGAKVF